MADPGISRLQDLFDHAVELPAAEHEAFVAALTGDDAALRDDLRRLLARHHASRLLPDQPALAELDRALQALAPEALTAARTIGPFRIEQRIGDGGMGRVYRAVREHDGIRQQVAIKLVRPECVNAALLQRFSTERRLLAALDHPGICRFIDAGTLHDGTPYIVMALIDGEPITTYCDTHRLTIAARLQLLRKVFNAVAHAHRKLIVHRDIKPANVLVDATGEPRLVDFGIAKSLADGRGSTATAERFFSPASAAPEQIRGDPITVGCDVHALGMLAYQLLCGRPPFDFDGLGAADIEHMVLNVPPPTLSQRVQQGDDPLAASRDLSNRRELQRVLRGDLDAIVQRCLRKSPGERYASVEQLDAELARFLAGQPVHARGGERMYRLRKFIVRNRVAVALSSGLAIALIGGGIAVVLQNLAITEQRNVALRERDRAQHVVELLQDAFAAANPLDATGKDVTAAQILDAARPQLDAFHAARPDVYAALSIIIARLDLDLNRYAVAADAAMRGIDAARRAGDRARLRELLLLHGRATTELADYRLAERSLGEAQRLDASARPDWLIAYAMLASRTQPERPSYAVEALHQAIAIAEREPDSDAVLLEARSRRVDALRLAGRPDAALDELRTLIGFQQRTLPPDHPRLALERLRAVELLRDAGRADEALRELQPLAAGIERRFGAHSALSARMHDVHAATLQALGRHAEAATAYAHAIELLSAANGPEHEDTLHAMFNRAQALSLLGRADDEADGLFRRALTSLHRQLGDGGNGVIRMRTGYARFLLARERTDDATAVMAAAHFDVVPAYGPDRHLFADALTTVAAAAHCSERQGDAACARIAALDLQFRQYGAERMGERVMFLFDRAMQVGPDARR